MPHITLECSSNVKLDFQAFFLELGSRLVATGHASRLGIKCRVVHAEEFVIVEHSEEFKMVNVLFRLREGRSDETKKEFSMIAMELLKTYLADDVKQKNIILSTEVKELIKGIDLTYNSIRERS